MRQKNKNTTTNGVLATQISVSPYKENMKSYNNRKYKFSFNYPPSLDITEEKPEMIIFGDTNGGPWYLGVKIEPTTFSEPRQRVNQINQEFSDREIKDNRVTNAENYLITRQIVEKQIPIDGYPALMTHEVSVWPGNGEESPEKTVFFIKDKHLFTIYTREAEENIWNSFKFEK